MPKTIEICYDYNATDKFCWFTREGDQHEHNMLDIEGSYLTSNTDLLAALDARDSKYAAYRVTLCIGNGAGQVIRWEMMC